MLWITDCGISLPSNNDDDDGGGGDDVIPGVDLADFTRAGCSEYDKI